MPEAVHLIYEDDSYKFADRGFGSEEHPLIPGLFVLSKQTKKWSEITKISTRGAKFGRMPEGGRSSVGWNYTRLYSQDYVDLPLLTSGSVNPPKTIDFDAMRQVYALRHNAGWKLDYVETVLYIRKPDLDALFR